ncbi:MAG: family 10 glycosylhydrolase, partial [Planctomycetales bacterium]
MPHTITGGLAGHGRMFAGYLERPLWPENFSANEGLDPSSQRSMDDWMTFYEAGMRAIEYLKYAGHNALVISVMSNGSTIYPSNLIEPTPRYDTGTFFSTGQDPVRKDVLEMLFRLCDREGIRLVPAMQFTSPLPDLENQIRDGKNLGMKLVDAQGLPWTPRNQNGDTQLTYYNPLHPAVQQSALKVMRELIDRYHHHDSFAGMAIGTSGHGYTLLPGPDWGFDDHTMKQFLNESRIKLAHPDNPSTQIQTAHRDAWLAWRADKLRHFHGEMADAIRNTKPAGKLYLATTTMHSSSDVKRLLRPKLPARLTHDELLLGIGIEPERYANPENGIVLVRARSMSTEPSNDNVAATQIDRSVELDREFAKAGKTGILLQSQPRQIRIPSFDAKSPFGSKSTHTLIVPHVVPAGNMSRRLFTS